jgi:hypothetical protein
MRACSHRFVLLLATASFGLAAACSSSNGAEATPEQDANVGAEDVLADATETAASDVLPPTDAPIPDATAPLDAEPAQDAPVDVGVGDCCSPTAAPGCALPAVQSCVCAKKPGCCEAAWEMVCTYIAGECGAPCGGGGDGGGSGGKDGGDDGFFKPDADDDGAFIPDGSGGKPDAWVPPDTIGPIDAGSPTDGPPVGDGGAGPKDGFDKEGGSEGGAIECCFSPSFCPDPAVKACVCAKEPTCCSTWSAACSAKTGPLGCFSCPNKPG